MRFHYLFLQGLVRIKKPQLTPKYLIDLSCYYMFLIVLDVHLMIPPLKPQLRCKPQKQPPALQPVTRDCQAPCS